ncbi:required for meiotic nuclear division protein 1 homolog [Lytechinus variegatus]|uniref:required for meiotic nuclear division protein 1 homolog n=1 Tax=Lytechinus variegatus TaxID=7654 RepID=UPI001BB1DE54|nr:required for meiotic nuclear division protein 1 homolog [Lytechinus variegatus]
MSSMNLWRRLFGKTLPMKAVNVFGRLEKDLAAGNKFQNIQSNALQFIRYHHGIVFPLRRPWHSKGQSKNTSRTVHYLYYQNPLHVAGRSTSILADRCSKGLRFKSSDAWLEKPVVFRTTSPTSSSTIKERGERNSRKVSKVPRPRTKKPSRFDKAAERNAYLCTAFTTAEEYNLEHLSYDLQIQNNKFVLAEMPQDAHDILHVQLSDDYYKGQEVDEPGEMFFFREGSVVFWNVPDPEIKLVMRIVGRHQHQPYEVALVNWENEQMNFGYHDSATSLVKGDIQLDSSRSTTETALEKFAFSNAMALSVKLAIWEYSLDQFVASIENIPDNMKLGKGVKLSREEVMKKTGELFGLRHRINLSSDLLISPDFYWDREELELIYNKMCQFLSISRRTNVMNEKLNHCTELVDLMRSHLEDRHSHRLEWMIIVLIMVEVAFEVIHYIRQYKADHAESEASPSQ